MPDQAESFAPVLHTPDGRYIIVRGRLWRATNPGLNHVERQQLIDRLMNARRQVKQAKQSDDASALASARGSVDNAKRGLGERGPVWWSDGSADWNRHLIGSTPYAEWFRGVINCQKKQM